VEFLVGKAALEEVFSQYFGFPLLSIPSTAPHSYSIIWGWYNRPDSGLRNSGHGSTPPQETKENVFKIHIYTVQMKLS
jgi:hypothetical protein